MAKTYAEDVQDGESDSKEAQMSNKTHKVSEMEVKPVVDNMHSNKSVILETHGKYSLILRQKNIKWVKTSDVGMDEVDQVETADPGEAQLTSNEEEVKVEVEHDDMDKLDFIDSVFPSSNNVLVHNTGFNDAEPMNTKLFDTKPVVDKDSNSLPCVFPTCPVRDPIPLKQGRVYMTGEFDTSTENAKNGDPELNDIGSPGINLRLYQLNGTLKIDQGSQTPLMLPTAITGTKELVRVASSFCDNVSSTEKSVQVALPST